MRTGTLKKLLLCAFVLCFSVIGLAATNYLKVYDQATQMMVNGNYAEAANLFDSIASYEDSSNLSMYCKANDLAEQGRYEEAINAFEFFGDYKDCKYLAVYYTACKIEAEAEEDPMRYLEAAEKYKQISLFRDSSARADACKQKLYDKASKVLEQDDYDTALHYFLNLDDFLDSATRVQECFYRAGQSCISDKQFEQAEKLFIAAGDYMNSKEQAAEAHKLAAIDVGSLFELRDEVYNIIHTYTGNHFYTGDISSNLLARYRVSMLNTGSEELSFTVTCTIDGSSYSWDKSGLGSLKSTLCSFASDFHPECFTEGEHTCTWYIDEVEILNDSYTVYPGTSEERDNEIKTAESMSVDISVGQFSEGAGKKLSGFSRDDIISTGNLPEGKEYVPVIMVTNPTSETVPVLTTAVIDGEVCSWDQADIEASDFMRFYSSNSLNPGKHNIQAYVNGAEVGTWSFEIIDEPRKAIDQDAVAADLDYASGTVLRMATGYNSSKTGLSMDADVAGEGVTLADGVTYHAGDLKPTWVEVEKQLDIKIVDKYQGNSASNEFDYWKERMGDIDLVSGTAAKLTEYGEQGVVVNIGNYLDQMPNFKAFLDANPIVRLSITGNTKTGAIYYSPYFDGVNDIERLPLMRVDMVQKLLDGEGEFIADKCNKTAVPVYEPYMPISGKIEIDVVKLDGSGVETIAKDYDAAGNIVAKMNEAGSIDGVTAVNMLREYIDKAYNGYYGTERSNLFIGQNAAWDADELVALLRCVVANPQTLNGTDSIQGIFTREDDNNQRRVDMMRFAGHLFGVRGLESRQDYLYFDVDGSLKDARQNSESYKAMERMNAIAKEGLISASFINNTDGKTKRYLENNSGFMHYDYNQTQTLYNDPSQNVLHDGGKYMAVMIPVACWQDGTEDGHYMRFTESWRSVKTDGWGISAAGVKGNENKLNAALALIDFAYSPKGMILMSYGPDAFIKTNPDGSYVTFMFNGTEMPEIADATRAELWEKASGNYTNYARQFLGSTLSFVKMQSFESQCTTDVGREGAGYISNAIALGTLKHPELAVTENPWYMSIPTVLPTTKAENDMLNTYAELTANGKFSSNRGGENLFVNQIVSGYTDAPVLHYGDDGRVNEIVFGYGEKGMSDADTSAAKVADEWGGKQYLALKTDAWNRLLSYYNAD